MSSEMQSAIYEYINSAKKQRSKLWTVQRLVFTSKCDLNVTVTFSSHVWKWEITEDIIPESTLDVQAWCQKDVLKVQYVRILVENCQHLSTVTEVSMLTRLAPAHTSPKLLAVLAGLPKTPLVLGAPSPHH